MDINGAILSEVENLGRLTEGQENTLYRLAMRQDDYGWVPTNMLLSTFEAHEDMQSLVERGLVEFSKVNPGGKNEFVSIGITLKGAKYFALFSDEMQARFMTAE